MKWDLWPFDQQWRAPVGDFPPAWASAWGDDKYGLWADLEINDATQRMRWIEPSGAEGFWMGSPQAERDAIEDKDIRDWANKTEHEPACVVVRDGFWLADTPCTLKLWRAVTGKGSEGIFFGLKSYERPVEEVSWTSVMVDFLGRVAQMKDLAVDGRLCLPTEAEWEYAARAGTRTAYWWGDTWDHQLANADVAGERGWRDLTGTLPVKHFPPNPWGLYDMHGNVWEWCADKWQESSNINQTYNHLDDRVLRGGSWLHPPVRARAACRSKGWGHVYGASRCRGFRFALRSSIGQDVQ